MTAWLGAFQRWQELAFGSGNGGASAPAASPPSVGVRDAIEQGNLRFKSLEGKLVGLVRDVNQDHRSLGMMVDLLLEDTRRTLMLPLSSLLEVFPKMARDLARKQGKEVDLEVQGSDIEIDRRILERLKDPLIHPRRCPATGCLPRQSRGSR